MCWGGLWLAPDERKIMKGSSKFRAVEKIRKFIKYHPNRIVSIEDVTAYAVVLIDQMLDVYKTGIHRIFDTYKIMHTMDDFVELHHKDLQCCFVFSLDDLEVLKIFFADE
jgi:hypothetical protein